MFVIRRERTPDDQVDACFRRLKDIHVLRGGAESMQPTSMKFLALFRG
jgi:hypothetical protein